MSEDQDTKNRKSILNLYAILGVSIVLSILPYSAAAILSLVFISVVLVWGYAVRKRTDTHSFAGSHATYIIRTVWLSSFFALVTTALACLYMIPQLNHAPFEACTNMLIEKGAEWIESASMDDVYAIMQPCIDGFIAINKMLLITALLIAGGPVVIYMAYRLFNGLSLALKGHRLTDEKSWF